MSNRVEKRFGLIGSQKKVLAQAFSQPSIPIESDPSIKRLLSNRLLIESESGYASLSKHLRAIGEDGLERHSQFEAPEQFIGVLDTLTALTRDFIEKARQLQDTSDVEDRFRNKCSELFESISRSLHIFQEQTENIDVQAMTLDAAERHFAFYQRQIKDYLTILESLTSGELVEALSETMAAPLERVFRRVIHNNMQDWIGQVSYLLGTIGKSLAKLRHTAKQARKLRAVVAHIQRNPEFSIPEPLAEAPVWLRKLAPSQNHLAINWDHEVVLDMGPRLLTELNASGGISRRKERQAGEICIEEEDRLPPHEPPPILKAMTEWIEDVGPSGVSAMEYFKASTHLSGIPSPMWLMALHVELEYRNNITWEVEPSWPHSDDQCLVDACFSTNAA